jgi:hypothetical protein
MYAVESAFEWDAIAQDRDTTIDTTIGTTFTHVHEIAR